MPQTETRNQRPSSLQLTLPAKAENVAVVRHALAGLAEEIGMDEPAVADLKTVVTEACMNVVAHAYQGEPGPLNVEAVPDDEGLTITVRDEGVGIRPQAETGRDSLRLGLSLIAALSASFAISGGLNRGTEVSMRLPLRGGVAGGDAGEPETVMIGAPSGTELVTDSPGLLSPVLTRIVAALAARRELSIDRVSDAVLVTDAVAAAAPSQFADGHVRLGLEDDGEGIGLKVGPLRRGAAEQIRHELDVPEVGGSLETLADELAVEEVDEGEYLTIRFRSAG
jgi:anti-sigma regulatory factor (Ser/Thr protein kinase)